MAQAFSGLRIVDLTTTIAGPHCTRMLADLGAEVIKIESPEGDMMRTRLPLRNGASTSWGQLNAGKKSVLLDLKRPEAVEAVKRLVADADVVVENYRPGVMRRLGIDYPRLAEINPRIVYCAISGYGQSGPSADLPAYAPSIHASSGYDLAHISYQKGRERPDFCGVFIADVLSGTYAFGAIAAALRQREVTGRGQMLDVSMLESMLTLTLTEIQASQFTLPPPPSRPMFGPVQTKDGFIMLAVASEKTFQALCEAAERPDWLTDPKYAKYMDRRTNWGALMGELEAWSKDISSAEFLKRLDAAGVPASAYRTVREALADPQIAHRRALRTVEDAGGTFKILNPPFRMSASATEGPSFAAALGEHTREVLAAAGLTEAEIAKVIG